MALLAWLKREGFGSYESLDEFTGELARRSTSALGALGAALVAKPEDLVEAARGNGHGICAEVVGDLRVAKGARLAALRALLGAGAGAQLAKAFVGAFDLSSDPRLPEADRTYLVRSGLKAFLDQAPPQAVNLEILRGAAAAETAARSISRELVAEVLSGYPATHTPALTIRHAAFGEPHPPDLEDRWIDVLARQHRAAKNAPPSAKRLGTAPEWPPVAPECMKPLLRRAEEARPAPAHAPSVAPIVVPPAPIPADGAPTKKQMPDLRPRARGGSNEESFTPDAVSIAPTTLRSAPTPVEAARLQTPSIPARSTPLRSLRFGEQIELVATRGTRAIERLFATFDVRCESVGRERALTELDKAACRHGPADVNGPMMDELLALATEAKAPPPWRLAARTVLAQLSPDRHATLPELLPPRDPRVTRPR